MFGRGFFFFKLLVMFLFIGILVLACGGLYNLGFTRGLSQGLVVSGAEATNLAPFPGYYLGSLGGPAPFLVVLGIFAVGFVVVSILGAIFGRRYWSKRGGRYWRYHHYHRRYPYYWGSPGWDPKDYPPEEGEPAQRA